MKNENYIVRKPMNKEEVRKYIQDASLKTKFYIGSDSTRLKLDGVWYADYATVIIVHKDGNKGARIFDQVIRMRDFDQNKSRPQLRLMQEVYFTSSMYLEMLDVLIDRDVEIHLDVNPDEKHGSSCVITQAIGYIRGTCDIEPKVKPDSFAASFGADRVAAGKKLHFDA